MTAVPVESQTDAQGDRFRSAAPAASTLAYRCFLHQRQRELLLLVQRIGWVQSFYRALRPVSVDAGGRHRGNSRTSQGEAPRSETADHLSDNGPQFITRDFKEFIRISGMTHVRTSPYYPQSHGKIERWHKSLKSECIRLRTPFSVEDAQRLVQEYVEHYNNIPPLLGLQLKNDAASSFCFMS